VADVAILTALRYLTGGARNPLALYYLLLVLYSSAALPPRFAWLLAGASVVCYVALHFFHIALPLPDSEVVRGRFDSFTHVLLYAFIAALIAWFGIKLSALQLLQREQRRAEAEKNARERYLVGLAALDDLGGRQRSARERLAAARLEREHRDAVDPGAAVPALALRARRGGRRRAAWTAAQRARERAHRPGGGPPARPAPGAAAQARAPARRRPGAAERPYAGAGADELPQQRRRRFAVVGGAARDAGRAQSAQAGDRGARPRPGHRARTAPEARQRRRHDQGRGSRRRHPHRAGGDRAPGRQRRHLGAAQRRHLRAHRASGLSPGQRIAPRGNAVKSRISRGALLVNLGTPSAPTAEAVRAYLAEFLADPRVVRLPRLVWAPILHGIVLRRRPAKSAEKYAAIWSAEGSPLAVHTRNQAEQLRRAIPDTKVEYAMRYSSPDIASAL